MGLLTPFHKYYLNCFSCMYTASCFATWQQSNVRDMHVDMVMKAWWSLNWESECRWLWMWHGCWFCQYLWSCWSAAIFPRQQFLGFTEKGLGGKKSNKQLFRGWPRCFKLIGRNKPNKQLQPRYAEEQQTTKLGATVWKLETDLSLDFCSNIQTVGSGLGINNMTAWLVEPLWDVVNRRFPCVCVD